MGQAEAPGVVRRLQLAQPWLWVVAVLAFGIGDIVTTTIGLRMTSVQEAGPLTSLFVDRYGLVSMVVVKSAVLGAFYGCWKITPRDYRVGIPLGLTILGLVAVWWNLMVKLVALLL
jgi:hypothetical protein